jgi:hypothetical protein
VAAEYYRESNGFSFTLADKNREATMGDEFILDNEACLSAILPSIAKVRIIRDGIIFREEVTHKLLCNIRQPGVYRAEAYLKIFGKYLPWIFSNPIYVK